MRRASSSSGFALLLVLWSLVILSALALGLAASVAADVRSSQSSWDDLQAERLAISGHEIAAYLQGRGLGTTAENLNGLPVETRVAGLKYRVRVDIGSIELILEGENKKLDLTALDESTAAAFLSGWTKDANRSLEIVNSIADWQDSDDEPRFLGAESAWYLGRGYLPRNSVFGPSDLFLVKGMTPDDFGPQVVQTPDSTTIRKPLPWFVSAIPSGPAVNPNYAPRIVLEYLPGMNPQALKAILDLRERSIFTSAEDFKNRVGITDSSLMNHLTFDRGIAPAVLSIGRLNDSQQISSERRVLRQIPDPRRRGYTLRFIGLVERNVLAD